MKNILARLFRKDPEIDYTIAEYLPVKVDRFHNEVNVTEYDFCKLIDSDEMHIDKIYQSS